MVSDVVNSLFLLGVFLFYSWEWGEKVQVATSPNPLSDQGEWGVWFEEHSLLFFAASPFCSMLSLIISSSNTAT